MDVIKRCGWIAAGAGAGVVFGGAVFYALIMFGPDLDWL